MDLKNTDRIEISIEQLQKLLQWRDENKDLVRKFNPVFTEAIIDVKNGKSLYFKDKNNIVEYTVLQGSETLAKVSFNKLIRQVGNRVEISERWKMSQPEIQNLIQDCITTHATLSAYICYLQKEVVVREENKVISDSRRKKIERHNRYNGENIIRLTKRIITIPNGARIKFTKAERRKLMESWNVRGHIRKMKSGKEVYVKPYKKGTGERQRRIYKIEES